MNEYSTTTTDHNIAIIGLGYVGLPLAIAFARKYNVLGFDINAKRIEELRQGYDRTFEADADTLNSLLVQGEEPFSKKGLRLSTNKEDLRLYNVFIVTVPTPVNQFKSPDLTQLIHATEMLADVLKVNDLVIYESTVYPGCTEENCVPILERNSGLLFNRDFFVGYSPERINPGDKVNTLTTIKKVTSGSTPETAVRVDNLYRSIISAGTHRAPSIKVAEASKVVENAQRDLNISFVNELTLIFDRLDIDTYDVLEAAGTKWNFLKYRPGLVGGHCIAVDPYYLTHKAQKVGYIPDVILSGRRVNEQMGAFIASKLIKLMIQRGLPIKGSKALILGITFKENCPDTRNTGVISVYHELIQFGLDVEVFDPWANPKEVLEQYNLTLIETIPYDVLYDAIVVAVAHKEFRSIDLRSIKSPSGVIFDTKGYLDRALIDSRL